MIPTKLGTLEKVDIRTVWPGEASDFTPWLANEENLALLGDVIGMELETEAEEQYVGPYRADILCKDTINNQWVVIENQYGKTDHSHLGQVITYAAGLEAVTLVWIAEKFTDEHRAAMDWLNEHTNDKINLFGLEIELWKIGNSLAAPKFNIVSQPNNWSRCIRKAATAGSTTDLKKLQMRYWTAFKEHIDSKGTFLKGQKPYPRSWLTFAIGRSGFTLASAVSQYNAYLNNMTPEVRAEFVINGPESKAYYAKIESQKSEIEKALGFPLIWYNPTDKQVCRIYTRLDSDFQDEKLWPNQFDWLHQNLENIHRVFAPMVKAFTPPVTVV